MDIDTRILLDRISQHDIEVLYESVLCGLESSGKSYDPNKIRIEKTNKRGGEADAINYFLVFAAGSGIWFSKKWADDYLWPQIKKRIDKPSDDLVEMVSKIFTK